MPEFQPDERFEHMLQLLDRAAAGDKELLAQIQSRGGFSKEELAPVIEYVNRKRGAQAPAAIDPVKLKQLQAAGATPEQIAEYQAKVSQPMDFGNMAYGMFIRSDDAKPTPGSPQPSPAAAKAPAAKSKAAPKAKPKAPPKAPASAMLNEDALLPEQAIGASALRMLENVAMPNTVLDSYGRPIDSPAQQLGDSDDPVEIMRRIEEGNRKKALLQESYKRAAEMK